MAKDKSFSDREAGKTTADYYKLNTKAIDDLVNASTENAPEVSNQELRKFGAKTHLTVSNWLKAILIKAWFAGVVCYFFLWGIGSYGINGIDLWLITAVALGFITDIVTNNILRFIEKEPGDNARYMMFAQKRIFITLPLNILYACLLMTMDITTYALINRFYPLGVGPILFGIVTALWDMLFIQCKRLLKRIIADAKAGQGKSPNV